MDGIKLAARRAQAASDADVAVHPGSAALEAARCLGLHLFLCKRQTLIPESLYLALIDAVNAAFGTVIAAQCDHDIVLIDIVEVVSPDTAKRKAVTFMYEAMQRIRALFACGDRIGCQLRHSPSC